jgi:omega-6 fatty acid desaturase (delta-12 desaturase)
MAKMMENTYTAEIIQAIRDHIKAHGYATNYWEPSFYLITTVGFKLNVLYLIHTDENYNPVLICMLAALLFRLFVIFHDLCHRSFFPTEERYKKNKGFNFGVAGLIEQWCMFPADVWSNGHSLHHYAHGNMSIHDGTKTVLTSQEFSNLSDGYKRLYLVFRSPVIFFLFSPLYTFWLSHLISFRSNALFILKYSAWVYMLYSIGSGKLAGSYVLAQYIAQVFGTMLFHLEHQVNVGYWKPFDKQDKWTKDNAELQGATVLQVPLLLEYATIGIEYHNVHHLDPGVPGYKTKQIYYELIAKGLLKDEKIGYWQQLISLNHTIFNMDTNLYE